MNKEQWHELRDKFLGREEELNKYVFEMDPDDIVDFSSFKKGIQILKKYKIN